MTLDRHLPLVEQILGAFKDHIGNDFPGYRNHVYRVVHLCYAGGISGAEDKEKIHLAACFHDIGIWTDKTLDYLLPSARLASEYLAGTGREAWIPEVSLMIEMHHRLRSCDGCGFPLVEVFRRADIADFSWGAIAMGHSADLLASLKVAFPNAGFHRRLLQLAAQRALRHPLNLLPMFRW
ncbi:MAG: hypothetical protein KF814_11770 [Nitrospiraceae bacterium]|nr:hypothetical protein [Nitrospiraceae bacterium]